MNPWAERVSKMLQDPDDLRLGQMALRASYVTSEQLEECIREQTTPGAAPLGAILVRKRYLKSDQLAELLREQSRQLTELACDDAPRFFCPSCSCLYSVVEAIEGFEYRCRECRQPLQQIRREQAILARNVGALNQDAKLPEDVVQAARDPERLMGRFVKLRLVGEGGGGAVWLSYDTKLGRRVAIKLLTRTEPRVLQRFLREASVVAKLRHPNIVPIYDVGTWNGTSYLVMEYIDGENANNKMLEVREAAWVIERIADAVEYAHGQKIIHRDIKPANILLGQDGTPYLADFGIAREQQLPSTVSIEGTIFGTPQYMAPEQARGEVNALGPQTDVYGLGATLYTLVTQRAPFEEETMLQVLEAVKNSRPPSPRSLNPALPKKLEAIILKAMEKDPRLRYPSAARLRDDLGAFMRGEWPEAATPGVSYRLARFRDRVRRKGKKVGLGLLIGVALVLAVGLGYLAMVAHPTEARANRLIDEAAGQIDKWEICLYQERSELAPRWRELENAVKKLDEALVLQPKSARALYYKAKATSFLWRWNEALLLIGQALQLDDNAAYRLLRARGYETIYISLRFDQLCQPKIADSLAGDIEAIRKLLVGDLQRAQELGNLKPEEQRRARAILALGEGRLEDAQAIARSMLDDDANDADARELLAYTLLLRAAPGDVQLAKSLLAEALGIKRSSVRLHMEFSVACRLAARTADGETAVGLLREGEEGCRRALEIAVFPEGLAAHAEVLIQLAYQCRNDAQAAVGYLREGIGQLEKGLTLDSQIAVLHLDLGTAHYEFLQYEPNDASHKQAALDHWQKASSLNPSYAPMLESYIAAVKGK